MHRDVKSAQFGSMVHPQLLKSEESGGNRSTIKIPQNHINVYTQLEVIQNESWVKLHQKYENKVVLD